MQNKNIRENQRYQQERNNSPQITQISAEKICKQKNPRKSTASAEEKEVPQITQISAEKICKQKNIRGREISPTDYADKRRKNL